MIFGNRNLLRGTIALIAVAASLDIAAAAGCVTNVPASMLAEPGVLTMTTSPSSPPMQYADKTGELKGMRIDVGKELASRLCLTAKIVPNDFAAMIPGLNAGRYDMLNTGLFFTEERAKTIIFIPNENQAFSISVSPGNPKKIVTLDDLNGKTVSTEFGSFADKKLHSLDEDFRKKGMPGMTVNSLENLTIAFQAMRAGQVDAVLTVDAAGFEYEKRGTSTRVLHGLFPVTAGLGFRKRELAEKVLVALKSMKADGSYDKVLANYGIDPFTDPLELKGNAN